MTPKRLNLILKIFLVATLVISAGGLYFANQQVTAVATDTSHLKAQVEVGQKQLTAYETTKAKVDSLNYVNDLANKILPASEDQSQVVAELTQFALRSNLNVAQISFSDTTATSTKKTASVPGGVSVSPITIQLKAGARYNDLLNFLQQTEQNRRKMQVTNISLLPDVKDRTKLSQVTIVLNLYSKKAGS